MLELISWLDSNGIQYKKIDKEVVEVLGFGKMFFVDTENDKLKSVFKKAPKSEDIEFNLTTDKQALIDESIFYVAFKFGDNWYYYDLREGFTLNILRYIGESPVPKLNVDFVNLGIHTPFELLNGSGSIKEWVHKAKYLNHSGLGICDKNTMAATILLQSECIKQGLNYVFGYTLDIKPTTTSDFTIPAKVYCITQEGLQNMLRIQKTIMVDSEDQTITLSELGEYAEGNVLVLGTLAVDWMISEEDGKKSMNPQVWALNKLFDKMYYQVDLSEYKAERIDIQYLNAVKKYFEFKDEWTVPPILICDQYYIDKEDYKNKINLNKVAGGAAHDQSSDQYFKTVDEHWETFSNLMDESKWDVETLFREMCQRTVEISNEAKSKFDTDRNFMPEYTLTDEEKELYGDRRTMFIELLYDGFDKLVPLGMEEVYQSRLDREVYVLESTNNVDYMLVQYDTVNWARSQGILVGAGRGSAGGSLVLYLLGITLVDPIKYDLLFERFLLPERAGLFQSDVTKIYESIDVTEYVEIEMENGKLYKIACDSMVMCEDEKGCFEVYADELQDGDNIIFDNKHLLWDLI